MSKKKGADEQFCRSCGELIKKKAEICPNCGVRPGSSATESSSRTYCSFCGNSTRAETEICPDCGMRKEQHDGLKWFKGWTISDSGVMTVFGGLFLLIAFNAVIDGGDPLVSLGRAVLFGGIGLLLLPQVQLGISVDFPITTVGRKRTVEERLVENDEMPCSVCRGAIKNGVKRTYSEEFVLFGVSTITLEKGQNYYCSDCVRNNG